MALTTQILKHKSRDIIALLAKLFTVKKKKKKGILLLRNKCIVES